MHSSVAGVLAVLLAVVCADPSGGYGGGQYHGQYHNQCGADGFYYKDSKSFVMCSNGNAYVQPCAPGSRNSGNYHRGGYYQAHHFCDVNLVDHGYGARHGSYGSSHGHRGSHGHSSGYGRVGHGYHGNSYGRSHHDNGYNNYAYSG